LGGNTRPFDYDSKVKKNTEGEGGNRLEKKSNNRKNGLHQCRFGTGVATEKYT